MALGDLGIDDTLALACRFGMAAVYFYLLFYFRREYAKSKQTEYPNKFFLAFVVLFSILVSFHLIYGTYELYTRVAENPVNLKDYFPWYVEQGNFVDTMANQVRPLYLVFYFIMNCVMAALAYPLEQAMGWRKSPFTILILACGSSLWLLFIPALSYTYFALVPISLGFLGFTLGFGLIIGVNVKLFHDSTGDVRARSLKAIVAFLCLGLGLILSMEVGWFTSLHPALTYRWEVVIGSGIQVVGSVAYRVGFKAKGGQGAA
ncbi:MAG: hypothetical protein ACTSU5_11150 [Promethearchaeota archaeon]